MSKSDNIYIRLTEKIIEKMKDGVAPWQKPWALKNLPQNFITKRPYGGFNMVALMIEERNCPYWLTFKQVKDLGGKLKKGEHGIPIVYYLFINKETGKPYKPGDKKDHDAIPVPRYYVIFNLEQTEGIEWEMPLEQVRSNSEIDEEISNYCMLENISLNFTSTNDKAFYSPKLDHIHVPEINNFKTENHFYATCFHEMVHSTGIERRLNRGLDTETRRFGDHLYSKEELVAEFGACFLMAHYGIFDDSIFDNSVSYLQAWAKKLEEQPSVLVSAANQAQKAVDFILKVNTEEIEGEE